MITRLWNLVQLSILCTRALFHKYFVAMKYRWKCQFLALSKNSPLTYGSICTTDTSKCLNDVRYQLCVCWCVCERGGGWRGGMTPFVIYAARSMLKWLVFDSRLSEVHVIDNKSYRILRQRSFRTSSANPCSNAKN